MTKKVVVLFFLVTCILLPNRALASAPEKEVWVDQAQVTTGKDELQILPGKAIELNEGQKVELVIELCKSPGARGVISLSSDLDRAEGLLRFRVEDYPETTIQVKCSGIVPKARVRVDDLVQMGERNFILVNIIYDRDGITQTVMSVSAVSMNPELTQSKFKIAEVEDLLHEYPLSKRQSDLAKALLAAAKQARASGNPTLAVCLCDIAITVMHQQSPTASQSTWYWLVIVILIMALMALTLMYINQSKSKPTGWIKPRR